MKKICFITTVAETLKSFVVELAKYIHENTDWEIHFMCDFDRDFKESLPDYIKYHPVHMKRGISMSGIKATMEMIKIFRREKFDMIQYSTPNASLYASLAGKFANVPVRLYCQWGIVYVSFEKFKRIIFRTIEKIVCKLSTNIQPDSKGNLLFSVSEKLYDLNKGEVIWNGSANGVDLNKFDIGKKEIWKKQVRELYDISHTTYVIGFVGRITRDKGINELLCSFKQILEKYEDVRLLLVGPKENDGTIDDELLKWAQKNENVILVGETQTVERYMSAMDVFVLPSYREGFGSVVIEAEAMGLPVIVSDIPGPTDAMKQNVTGITIKKQDYESLTHALEGFINQEYDAEIMAKASIEFVRNRFDSKKLYQKILENRKKLLKL